MKKELMSETGTIGRLLRHLRIALAVMAIAVMMIASMPAIVYANTVTAVVSEDSLYEAEKMLDLYHNNTLIMFPREERELLNFFPKAVYHTDSNYYMYSGWFSAYSRPGQKAWSHARSLYYSGKIHGATFGYQCTFFAQMWFYDIYGFNSSGNGPSGNGSSFADRVYSSAVYYDEEGKLKHWFQYDSQPKTMGIISISAMSHPGGHVICVDEVDYINNTITISDGNVRNNGDVRIRKTYTLSEFYRANPGRYTFVNPTTELLDRISGQE